MIKVFRMIFSTNWSRKKFVHVSMNNSRLKPVSLSVIYIFPTLKVVSGLTVCEGGNNFVSVNQRKYKKS